MQTTLTRIFIVLESVSHGLSENLDEMSRKARKFKGFFPPKIMWSPKKKKKRPSPKLRPDFLAEIQYSKVFSDQNQVVSKKKRSSPKLRLIFRPNSKIQTFEGGYFQLFTKNRPQNHQKRAILHTSQAWLRY